LKRQFFENNDFDKLYPGYVNRAEQEIRNMLDKEYECSAPLSKTFQGAEEEVDAYTNDPFAEAIYGNQDADMETHQNELDSYFAAPKEHRKVDLVQWWKLQTDRYPTLSKVAQRYLAIVGSSVCVERVFNGGVDMMGLRRYSLKSETFANLMFGSNFIRNRGPGFLK
jgi:hypothetical protein